jgi:hypothetical protein
MIEAMDWAGRVVTGVMADWPDWAFAQGIGDPDRPNIFPQGQGSTGDERRGRAVANMHWQLGHDEALIIDLPAHDGLWMLTNMGAFFNSMDYLHRPVSFTPSRAAIDTDGHVRFVLCHSDPFYLNWIDTQAFERGNLIYRHMLAGLPVRPLTRRVAREDLAAELPTGSILVTPAERHTQMLERLAGIRRRYRL